MGKKKYKKEIRKAFKDWDDITPEEQMKNADDFYNISESNFDDILCLGVSNKPLIDEETGIETDIINEIVSKLSKNEDKNNESDILDNEEDDEEESYDIDSDTVKNVLVAFENNITAAVPSKEDIDDGVVINEPVSNEKTVDNIIEDDTDKFNDVRKFGSIVRYDLGIVNFNDELSSFSINEYEAMVTGLADNIDVTSLPNGIIELFKKALIVYRYPAALFTHDEFVAIDLVKKGKIIQGGSENVYFVDVFGKYIAVYFVYTKAIERFDNTIRDILNLDDPELGDPYYNVWFELATELSDPKHSFGTSEESADIFYASVRNEKRLVKEYIIDKYIKPYENGEEESDFDILNKTDIINKFHYIMDIILEDDEEEDDDELDDDEEFNPIKIVEEEEDVDDDDEDEDDITLSDDIPVAVSTDSDTKPSNVVSINSSEPVKTVEEVGNKETNSELLAAFLSMNNEPKKEKDDSMVIPVIHSKGKR